MMHNTDWIEVVRAGLSTTSLSIDERDLTMISILQRFQGPLTSLFERRLRDCFGLDCELANDIFSDFSIYLMENRKTIFRQADQEKGKLRSFIFTIAIRFFQRNIRKYMRHGVTIDPDLLNIQKQEREVEQEFEVDYVKNHINIALKNLKMRDRSDNKIMYRMFCQKYFNKTSKELSACELALESGELREISSDLQKKRVEDRVYQRIHKAKEIFIEELFNEIRKTLALPQSAAIPQEEQQLFCRYVNWIDINLE